MELTNKVCEQAGYIVICGLSASGKTSLVKHWIMQLQDFLKVPEHTELLDNKSDLSFTPDNRVEKEQKQNLILELDIIRSQWAQQKLTQSKWVISDKDFTSALSYTYAEYMQGAEIQVFDWLAKKAIQQLNLGNLHLADYYFYLDVSLETRDNRRKQDRQRKRKSTFFETDFAIFQRDFYFYLFNHKSNHSSFPGYIIDASMKPSDVYQQCLFHLQQKKPRLKGSVEETLTNLLNEGVSHD